MVNHEQISLFLLIISFATYVRDAGIQVRMQRVLYLRLGALFCWRMQTNCSIDLYLASFFSVFFVDLSKCAAASIVSSRSTSIPTNSCIFRPPPRAAHHRLRGASASPTEPARRYSGSASLNSLYICDRARPPAAKDAAE